MSSNHNLFPKNSPIGLLWLSLARSFLLVFIPAYTSCYPLTGTAGVFEYQPGPDSSQDIWTTIDFQKINFQWHIKNPQLFGKVEGHHTSYKHDQINRG
jgi:hypothetical protein